MRIRDALLLTALAAACGAFTYQAITAKPPEPYVRLAGRMPLPPVLIYGCSARHGQVALYTTGDGEQLDPVPTGHPCGYGGLGPTRPEQ